MHKHVIPSSLSQAATSKVLWAHAHVNSAEADRYLRLAKEAEGRVIGTPSASPDQIIAKLALLLDWESEALSPSSRALIQSIIADLEGNMPTPQATPQPSPPKPRAQALGTPAPAKRKATRDGATFRVSSVQTDGRSRPVIVDGVMFASLVAASRETGLTLQEVRSRSRDF